MKKYIDIVKAEHVKDYTLKITFSDGHVSTVDFKEAMSFYCKGYYEKYKRPALFKKFKVDEGKLVWGKDWDVVFDDLSLYKGFIPVPGKEAISKKIKHNSKAA